MKILRFLILIILLCGLIVHPSQANEVKNELSFSKFQNLPILHDGRIQPIHSFAKFYFNKFSNKEKIDNLSPGQWLLETIFAPEKAIDHRIFYIDNPNILPLPQNVKKENKLYSYVEIATALQKNNQIINKLLEKKSNNYSNTEINLLTIYNNHILYTQLLRSMTLFIPVSSDGQSVWQSKEKIKGPEKILIDRAQNNVLFRIIPHQSTWNSPWESYRSPDKIMTKTEVALHKWQNMTNAYRNNDITQWNTLITQLQSNNPRLILEVWYNKLSLLNTSFYLYILTLIFLLLGYLKNQNLIKKITIPLFFSAITFHTGHILLRSVILERPPVGTLYESVIFVALITVIIGAILYKNKQMITITIGTVLSVGLLLTAQGFIAEEPMGTLVAVLNTNFWLATHVLCITIGYGLCLLSSALAHVMFIKPNKFNALLTALLIASLLFTTIGTVLGGIWADQSWGRFWGWDPKENGALLIVLWLIWILHGKVSSHLRENTYLIACALLSIIVILAWFGVNLLNVGLHSYGFVSGIAWGIGAFCVIEFLLISSLYWYAQKNRTLSQ